MDLQHMLVIIFALATLVASAPCGPSCFETILPIDVDTEITTYNVAPFASTLDSKEFLVQSLARDGSPAALVGNQAGLKATYDIAVQYCSPLHGGTTLQILSHGVGFDKSYWDFGNATYNYISAATAAGYATLAYDRLGVGQSSHPDPYSAVQSATQVAILAQLTKLVRAGNLSASIPKPEKVVHVGHSLGSLLTNGLVAAQPTLSDGIVLTGFSYNTTWVPYFELAIGFNVASESNPQRFGHLSSGYLTWADKYDAQAAFFNYPYFDPAVLDIAEQTKAPFAIAELLSFGTLSLQSPQFRGPVLMMSGQHDLPFCGWDCAGVIDGPYSAAPFIFSNVSSLETYIQPDVGHALNLHLNASSGYDVITSFLQRHEL